MANIKVAVVNASTVINSADVPPVVDALQKQVRNDFAPVWGIDADLTFYADANAVPAGSWVLAILDNSDQAGALGYHDLTPDGFPLGKVFAGTDKQYGEKWQVTASHELLEMLADPDINLTAFVEKGAGSGVLYAYEVCDACEGVEYSIDNVPVSDFVYPAWFESFRQLKSTQFDQQGQVGQPFQLLPGGYIGVYNIGSGSGWQQITAEGAPHHARNRPRVGSRRDRRRISRAAWLRSTYHKK